MFLFTDALVIAIEKEPPRKVRGMSRAPAPTPPGSPLVGGDTQAAAPNFMVEKILPVKEIQNVSFGTYLPCPFTILSPSPPPQIPNHLSTCRKGKQDVHILLGQIQIRGHYTWPKGRRGMGAGVRPQRPSHNYFQFVLRLNSFPLCWHAQ